MKRTPSNRVAAKNTPWARSADSSIGISNLPSLSVSALPTSAPPLSLTWWRETVIPPTGRPAGSVTAPRSICSAPSALRSREVLSRSMAAIPRTDLAGSLYNEFMDGTDRNPLGSDDAGNPVTLLRGAPPPVVSPLSARVHHRSTRSVYRRGVRVWYRSRHLP